jgi:thiamine-phosphate pyrophosphorylase
MAAQVDYSLYVILDSTYLRKGNPEWLAAEVCEGGATVIQYRAKGEDDSFHRENLHPIRRITQHYTIPLVINDDLELALRYGADGIHLGQADLPIKEARKRGGDDFIVGATVRSTTEAIRAIEHGADYLSVGSMFHTVTKEDIRIVGPDILEEICHISSIPTIAIGGITRERLGEVLSRGPHGVAVVSSILDSPDPRSAARRMRDAIDTYLHPSR